MQVGRDRLEKGLNNFFSFHDGLRVLGESPIVTLVVKLDSNQIREIKS